jgi:hypothetical protein
MVAVLCHPYPFVDRLVAHAWLALFGQSFGNKFWAPLLMPHQLGYALLKLFAQQYPLRLSRMAQICFLLGMLTNILASCPAFAGRIPFHFTTYSTLVYPRRKAIRVCGNPTLDKDSI